MLGMVVVALPGRVGNVMRGLVVTATPPPLRGVQAPKKVPLSDNVTWANPEHVAPSLRETVMLWFFAWILVVTPPFTTVTYSSVNTWYWSQHDAGVPPFCGRCVTVPSVIVPQFWPVPAGTPPPPPVGGGRRVHEAPNDRTNNPAVARAIVR